MNVPNRFLISSRHGQRGIAVIEMAIVLPVLFLLMVGVTEIGRILYQYNTLNKANRDAVRYLTGEAAVGSTDVIFINDALEAQTKNLVVYGNIAGSGPPLIGGLTVGDVTVSIVDALHVGVDVVFEYDPIFSASLETFGYGAGPLLAFDLYSSVVMRAL